MLPEKACRLPTRILRVAAGIICSFLLEDDLVAISVVVVEILQKDQSISKDRRPYSIPNLSWKSEERRLERVPLDTAPALTSNAGVYPIPINW